MGVITYTRFALCFAPFSFFFSYLGASARGIQSRHSFYWKQDYIYKCQITFIVGLHLDKMH